MTSQKTLINQAAQTRGLEEENFSALQSFSDGEETHSLRKALVMGSLHNMGPSKVFNIENERKKLHEALTLNSLPLSEIR